ncbi:Ig heavy chain Mem5 [Huso huso]|uniref:Ig heavy chain Mem5 n=1 Tax=Huso huso TaxID=61971 RepID=A0ABR0YVX2_HUSHU
MNLSGVLYLVLICSRSESQVFQSPNIKVLEWKPVEIHCNQNITTSDPLFWYQQQPNKNPQLLIYAHSGTKEEGHFKMNISEKGLSATLSTHKIEVNDTAVYYCAVRPTLQHSEGKVVQ